MIFNKTKYLTVAGVVALFFNMQVFAATEELTHEEQVAKIAAPLFLDGMRKSDKKWIVRFLSKTDEEESETNRPLADVEDIVQRTLAFCPGVVVEECDLKTRKTITDNLSYTRSRTIAGFSKVPLSERDELLTQAKSVITDPQSLSNISCILDALSYLKNKEKRKSLTNAIANSALSDEQRLYFIEAIKDITSDVEYSSVVNLFTQAQQKLGIQLESTDNWRTYQVAKGLALNATPEKLEELVSVAQKFLGKYHNTGSYHSITDAFEIIGLIPSHLRDYLIIATEDIMKKLKQDGDYSHLEILRGFTGYENLEQAQAFIGKINPIILSNPEFIKEIFRYFYRNYNPIDREHLFDMVVRLENHQDLVGYSNFFPNITSVLGWHCIKYRNILVTEVEEIAEEHNLDRKLHNDLLILIGQNTRTISEINNVISAIQNFSWQDNPNPDFEEKLYFIENFYGLGVAPFCIDSDGFITTLEKASKYLTPELIEKQNCFYCKHPRVYLCNSDYGYECGEMDADEQGLFMEAVFKSSAYDSLSTVVDIAGKQLKKISDAKAKLTATNKADLVLAVAKIEPTLRESKVKAADEAAKTAGDAYFVEFMKHLEAQ